jgi:hypothetical protein
LGRAVIRDSRGGITGPAELGIRHLKDEKETLAFNVICY